MKKLLSLFLVSLLALTGVFAATSTDYRIDSVKINDFIAEDVNGRGNIVYAERGHPLELNVFVSNTGIRDIEDIKVRAWVEGYEYEDVEDISDMFDLTKNVSRSIPLVLNLPEDMDASTEYTLYVKVSDKVNDIENSYPLRVEETRRKLNIQDVIFRPSNAVDADRYLRTVVRLENLGSRKEENIKVTVSIPELGVSAADYINELVAVENEDDDEETSQSTNELVLQIPRDAKTGDYDVKITAEYNRGHDIVTETETIHVNGKTIVSLEDAKAIISMDTSAKDLAQGKETVYKIALASLTDENIIYTVEVAGVDTWASSNIEPALVTLEAGKTAEMLVKVTPNKDVTGNHAFTIKLKEGNVLVKETTLNANVIKAGVDWSATKTVLEYGFGVLVIILVILGLVIAFKRKPAESSGESESEESYY